MNGIAGKKFLIGIHDITPFLCVHYSTGGEKKGGRETMTDEELKARYQDSEEFRDAVKDLPIPLKWELVKGVSLLETGYRIGLAEGIKKGAGM